MKLHYLLLIMFFLMSCKRTDNVSESRKIGSSDIDYIYEYTVNKHDYIKMSYVELHTGTLTKVNIRGLTVEEYCKHLCEKYGYEIAYEGDTYIETLMDADDTYKVLNGELYKCDDIQHPEDDSYLVNIRSNKDGTYEYIAQFYNGGTCLDEVLEKGIKRL